MEKQKAHGIVIIYNWLRVIVLLLFFTFVIIGLTNV